MRGLGAWLEERNIYIYIQMKRNPYADSASTDTDLETAPVRCFANHRSFLKVQDVKGHAFFGSQSYHSVCVQHCSSY